jgi:cyclic pyranopterin phosphate synthase
MRIYRFEDIDDSLPLLPMAARRALDAAGIKVSLETWRGTALEAKRALVEHGSGTRIDVEAVKRDLASFGVASSSVEIAPEPPADAVPPALVQAVTESAWRSLAPLDRYALAKVARGKHPEQVLPRACAEIAPLSTHLDARGQAHMVDVGAKEVTARRAVARGRVAMEAATLARLRAGDVAKGDVLATARIAGIQAAKRTSELIPLCHAIALSRVTVDFAFDEGGVVIEAAAEARDRTGVEMEALTAASVAALTVYDMLKSVDRGMRIAVELVSKSGGKTGEWTRE